MTDIFSDIAQAKKSRYTADFLPTLFGQNLSAALDGNKTIVLYGAGSAGNELYECLALHGIDVNFFCDKNSALVGSTLQDVPIISFDELCRSHKSSIIVIASNNYKYEIKADLDENGFENSVFIADNDQLFHYLQIYKWHYDLANLEDDRVNLEKAYQLLADEQSKTLFKQRIAMLTSYADYGLFKHYIAEFSGGIEQAKQSGFKVSQHTENYESYLYFNNDILKLGDGEVLLDAGAFDGDSTIEFIHACDRNNIEYSHIYCIEADKRNFEKLQHKTQSYPHITCLPVGLWSSTTRLKFATSSSMFITEARIVDDAIDMNHGNNMNDGEIYIDTVSIDEQFSDKKVSFIKMDIEGAETEALRGAEVTIKRYKPRLAISVYHKKKISIRSYYSFMSFAQSINFI